jgi:hypothetical protein
MVSRRGSSIVDIKTDIRTRLIQRHSKPILRTESDRIALPLLLDPESSHDFGRLVVLAKSHQTCISGYQAKRHQVLVCPGPVESCEVGQFAMMGHSVMRDLCFRFVDIPRVDFV